jgi:hypothetical protein
VTIKRIATLTRVDRMLGRSYLGRQARRRAPTRSGP